MTNRLLDFLGSASQAAGASAKTTSSTRPGGMLCWVQYRIRRRTDASPKNCSGGSPISWISIREEEPPVLRTRDGVYDEAEAQMGHVRHSDIVSGHEPMSAARTQAAPGFSG